MTRDAKVGLVIVFAFVFLLGTILVHRMQGNSAEQLASGDSSGSGLGDDGNPVGSGTDAMASPVGSSLAVATTAVDAQPADDLDPPVNSSLFRPPANAAFGEPARTTNAPDDSARNADPFGASRRQTNATDSSDSGAHISLTEPDGERQPAAVVERRDAGRNASASDLTDSRETRTSGLEVANPTDDSSPRTKSSSLDARHRTRDSSTDERDADSLVASDPPIELDSSAGENGRRHMPANELSERVVGRTIPRLDTPPSAGAEQDPDELESPRSLVQPAAVDKRPESKESTAPRLPKFGDPPQPTIESVPDRGTPFNRGASQGLAGNERGTNPPAEPASRPPLNFGERTYTVKSGDSFWSISAKQYGTGKYFRALEDYNQDRLVTPGGDPQPGEKHLVPGLTIVLPDVSVLKMRSAPKTSIPGGRDTSTPTRDSLAPPTRDQSSPSRESRAASRPADVPPQTGQNNSTRLNPEQGATPKPNVYIVEDGDMLTTIALRKLGSSKRWDEIYRLNQAVIPDPNRLKVGTPLTLPAAGTENAADRSRVGR